jgi:predicted small metal-binding protein
MGKIIDCHKVNPTSDCQHVVRGANEEEVLRNAAEHARNTGSHQHPSCLLR